MTRAPRFHAKQYREDFNGLTHWVRDTDTDQIVDEAMTPDEANDLANGMNGLDREFNHAL